MNELVDMINKMEKPVEGFNLINYRNKWWGVGKNSEIVYGIDSSDNNVNSIVQTTKLMKVYIATDFICKINDEVCNKKLSIYVLEHTDVRIISIFIQVCNALGDNVNEQILLNTFYDLKELFANKFKPSDIELQGMYGELFSMYYLKKSFSLDIAKYYQKEMRRKFDFSLTDTKKIEVKTTIRPERIHHFLHQQLDTDRLDIRIISILLQKDDKGMSLKELIHKCKDIFKTNPIVIIYIESMIKNIDESELNAIAFNEHYSQDNFKIYNGLDIPRLQEKNVDGVYNIEYDVDFSNVKEMQVRDFKNWAIE